MFENVIKGKKPKWNYLPVLTQEKNPLEDVIKVAWKGF